MQSITENRTNYLSPIMLSHLSIGQDILNMDITVLPLITLVLV